MKKVILFVFIAFAITAQGQTLNDLLFSGKLKSDTSSVVRKTDDLRTKIDTSKRKPVEPVKTTTRSTDVSRQTNTGNISDATQVSAKDTLSTTTVAKENTIPTKSNNKIWKEYSDALIAGLKDVLSSKKVKKDSYYFLVEYEIGTDGVTSITNVTISPDNAFLLEQVKQRITDSPPQLNPVFDPNNKPLKVKRRYNFYITKE